MSANTETTRRKQYSHDPNLADLPCEDEGPVELQEMFAALRSEDIVTIEGDACCTGCTSAAAANHAEELEAHGEPVKGAAYYHEQDLNECYDHKYQEAFVTYDVDSLYVAFGGRGDTSNAEVAGLIMQAAHEAGLEAEWSGDDSRKVKVNL